MQEQPLQRRAEILRGLELGRAPRHREIMREKNRAAAIDEDMRALDVVGAFVAREIVDLRIVVDRQRPGLGAVIRRRGVMEDDVGRRARQRIVVMGVRDRIGERGDQVLVVRRDRAAARPASRCEGRSTCPPTRFSSASGQRFQCRAEPADRLHRVEQAARLFGGRAGKCQRAEIEIAEARNVPSAPPAAAWRSGICRRHGGFDGRRAMPASAKASSQAQL